MLVILGVALALNLPPQGPPPTPPAQQGRQRPVAVRDSTDTAATTSRHHRPAIRQPVTTEILRTAFKDPTARTTLTHARAARLTQDSALVSYDAMSYQRISAGMGFTAIGRDRLLFRHESVARIRWQQGVGVWMDAKGARTAVPMVTNHEAKVEIENETQDPDLGASIPYFPGNEPFWIGSDIARSTVNERELVHPIADGAEAYYTYETGDSISFKLPNGTVIQLRELKIRPRVPKWNLAVGSLWFDTKSGQLVRAAYRLSVPMDIWAVARDEDPKSMDDVPVWVKPMITPMKAELAAVAVEYGLHEGRFWLPRLRLAEGSAQVSFMHVPFKMEESFKYASVNSKDTIPAIPWQADTRRMPPDSLTDEQRRDWRDSVRESNREQRRAERDSVRKGLKNPDVPKHYAECDTSDTRVHVQTRYRYDEQLKVAVRVPCDISKLEHSPDLPKSIFDPGEELFGAKELESLKAEALSLTAQAPFSLRLRAGLLPPPVISYGPSMMRYNRVEGLSFGGSVEQQFGGGYAGTVVGRIGLADREPNIELTGARSNVTQTIGLGVYNHLVSASDWGHPLSFGSSFSALMFGRDEGFYYRTTGLELTGSRAASFGGGTRVDWRTFTEQERTAKVNTSFAVNGGHFPDNVVARRGQYTGFGARITNAQGLDPKGFRLFTDLRLEAATGDSIYGRGALDLTASHGIGRLAASVTVAGGSSVGGLPPQRYWFLGGSQTVRGQSPDTTQSGNAFWLTRVELGANDAGMRPMLFGDLGWTGDRTKMSQVGRPLSGVGAGVSFLDGLFRFDVARGIYPRKQFRVDLYLESKF
jgi:Haemolysin secretion/activation protein ShlB/FhaC/HecB